MPTDLPAEGGSYTRDPTTGALVPSMPSVPDVETPEPAAMPTDTDAEVTVTTEPKAAKKEK